LKKPIQILIVMLALCMAMAVAAVAQTPSPDPATRQFLASLAQSAAPAPAVAPAVPAFLEMTGGHCPASWCTAAARAACESQNLPGCTPGCTGLACDSRNCTEHCACVPDMYCF
jgi:hypothetical protein